jgi:hypothetical protein
MALGESVTRTLPELSLGSEYLPWALARVRESIAVQPEHADRASEPACAKGAAASISRGAGISATAGNQIAYGRSAAGKQHAARPNTEKELAPELDMPTLRKSAVGE